MKSVLCLLWSFLFGLNVHAQAVYVDCNIGKDDNPGTMEAPVCTIHRAAAILRAADNNSYTMKINPGIYVLDGPISIKTAKTRTDKRISIEATIMPDDTIWTPEKMPVILSISKKEQIDFHPNFVVGLLIEDSDVTIKGIKFNGYSYPNSRYFPIARLEKKVTDLLVEQCLFVGDPNASHIQVGVIANGNEINIDHCVFINTKNAAVFWVASGSENKTGNRFTNNIVYGATQCAVWFAWPDDNFVVKNNIIANCKHAWIRNNFNTTNYTIENCLLVNNQHFLGETTDTGVIPSTFEMNEKNVLKEGSIIMRWIEDLDGPIPMDYLHPIPSSDGYNLGAGLFRQTK